jgi:hypothetical protein
MLDARFVMCYNAPGYDVFHRRRGGEVLVRTRVGITRKKVSPVSDSFGVRACGSFVDGVGADGCGTSGKD